MYISYLDYMQLGEKQLPEFDFRKYEYEAERVVDNVTTGVDGVKKLQVAFPENEYDRRAVVMTMAALISKLAEIETLKEQLNAQAANGESGPIKSRSSGSESISYSTTYTINVFHQAANDAEKEKELGSIARNMLRGVKDANGVNLLYGGCYV